MYRLFVAIDLPEDVKKNLSSLCYGLPGAKWVDMEQVHLTLRFIGEVDGGIFRDIRAVLEDIEAEGFNLQIKGLGCFPPRKDPRVLWAGIESSGEMLGLKKKIDSRLMRVGIEPEKRKFSPHITLARFRQKPSLQRVADFLSGNGLFSLPLFPVTHFHLYSSVLTPKGALHQIETSYPLLRKDVYREPLEKENSPYS
ncbi:MAG: RNA 2',3'-cyclic phosphodiesterase [Desulfobulbaceae bacterium]|uniref:RNA 2',3'-cyclic phosphodiesterase n=1 Tax=Candidatus Desulfobia pelagia TaxID=2841692 RepID=A0A8J6NI82_9BACT|nr:RNA 2',3'-cyclic phosphodiesterase [Candidatus Desulfobia pelagia]